MLNEPNSRLCPRCQTSSMVSTLEVDEETVPENVWRRLGKRRKQKNVEWWFCSECYYAADLAEYIRRYPLPEIRKEGPLND